MVDSSETTVLLKAEALVKSFEGVQALKGVSLDLRAGEVHALVGENGAGKTTLIKIITGAIQPDGGTLTIVGRRTQHNSPSLARSLGVSAIYQQPTLFPHLSVSENIALSLETGSLWKTVHWKARRAQALALLERCGASIDPDRMASTLTMPEQQLVEIAKAVGMDARIFIMDEPTASLTDVEVERLFGVIRMLRDRGAGIIYISHRLHEIRAIADRITVLRDGEKVTTRTADEVEQSNLIDLMVGRPLASVFPKRVVPIGGTALELRNVSSMRAGVHDVSLDVRRGEILGIVGLVGSGRTQLAEMILGITPADSGEVFVNGDLVRIESPSDAIRLGIGYVPEDRRRHGVVLELAITANTSLANLKIVSRWGLIDQASETSLSRRYVERLGIKSNSVRDLVGTLSGGNQQKVAVARWLAIDPCILILDEPTQGVDVGAKLEIHRLMMDCAERGVAIVMISSELPEILGMSDRIAVMRSGTLAGILSAEEATQQRILALSLGHIATGTMSEIQ